MKKMQLVMVGNGMAGVRTLEELLKIAPDLYEITIFGAEPHPNYNRILLSPVLAGEQTLEQIVLNDWAWYAEHGLHEWDWAAGALIAAEAGAVVVLPGAEDPGAGLLLAAAPGVAAPLMEALDRCGGLQPLQ